MTPPLVMLDTDISSYIIKRNRPWLRTRLREFDPASILVSVVVQAELLYGLQKLPPDHYLHDEVRAFLDTMQLRAWDENAADIHARLRYRLISSGHPIGEMDTMIAAHAIALDAVLVTTNTRHFARIAPPLLLDNWTTDPGPSHASVGAVPRSLARVIRTKAGVPARLVPSAGHLRLPCMCRLRPDILPPIRHPEAKSLSWTQCEEYPGEADRRSGPERHVPENSVGGADERFARRC
jgi:tRNA(fMet)-specific endonuclease VapC